MKAGVCLLKSLEQGKISEHAFPLSLSKRGMGTSFRRNDFWDRLGGPALPVIG